MVCERAHQSLHTVLLGKRHGGSQSLPCPAVTPLIVPSGLGFSMNVAASPELGLRAPSPSAQNCCVTSVKNYEIKIILFCLVRNSQGSVCVVSSLQSSWKLSRLSALSSLSPELRTFFPSPSLHIGRAHWPELSATAESTYVQGSSHFPLNVLYTCWVFFHASYCAAIL